MKQKSFIMTGALVAAIALCGPVTGFAASKKATASPAASASPMASPAASPAEKAPRAIPFKGKAASVDQSAKTFAIESKTGSRTYKVTDKTTVTKAGAPSTLAELAANDYVTGSYMKAADGTFECKSVKIGGPTDAEKAGKKSKKSEKMEEASPAPSASPKK